ncbi:hypothetical protein ACFSUS_08015 [Spirosoma soli]|uniref:Uncharacterized protein n=1 Tax=Spirosoma soli TaxID=1770529 RepID=A0ABW5M0M0_9BACT
MITNALTPEEEAEKRRHQRRLELAREWMKRKRQEQQEMIDSFQTDPLIIAAYEDLKRRNQERGTPIVEL